MKKCFFFWKMFENPQTRKMKKPTCFEKKFTVGRIIPPFSFESSESDSVFNHLHDWNSIFRARRINSEWVFRCTVQDFAENLEDTEVPALASISHNQDSERSTKVAGRKYSIFSHFSKDRNCEICKNTKSTRIPCRRRTGESVLREENFVDLITANHKFSMKMWMSKHQPVRSRGRFGNPTDTNHICVKPKLLRTTDGSLRKFLEPSEKPQVISSDNLANLVEDSSWN